MIYIGSEPLLIAARKDFPANDLKGLIAYLKANPDKVSVGIAGVGAAGHLAGIAFQKADRDEISSSCLIAATRRRCRTCWRGRSTS